MRNVELNELALKKVRINGNIIGKFGKFEIEQEYKNNTEEVLEVGYTFPIVETATVVGFEINVGDKVLKGKCKETGEAKKEYQENIVRGNSSYMMEQNADNIFKISIGKIDKGEEVKVKIQYIDKFEITDNTIKILMPTLVTPRYNSEVTENLQYGKTEYTVDFNINIDKLLKRKSIYCPSHEINLIDEENQERIEILNYDLSKDFKLNIELKNELSSNAITSKTIDKKDMVYLSFMPEILDTYEDSEKEYVFIVDVSGSMSGEKIDETKRAVIECLKQLDEGDKFNIIAFETKFEVMNMRAIEYNEENLQKAIKYINSLRPLGGTEILNPIKFALYEREIEKIILLFTDGQVGNESEIISFVENNISRSRIFPFGIDSNVNSAFIKQLAKVGNGKAELILPKEKIDDKIIRTFERIQTPLLENLEIDYGENNVLDEIKEERCLFNYEFFNVFAKIEKIKDDIKLKGKILDKEYEWIINKESISTTNVDLEVLYAKTQMERLEEYIRNTYDYQKKDNYKKMIIELSEKYNINSKYTSFITVNEREKKLFDVPKYQETTLSNNFLERGFFGDTRKMFKSTPDMFMADFEMCEPAGAISHDIDIPSFLRKNKSKVNRVSIEERLQQIVDKYFKEFLKQEEKSILTYLLYALYYLKRTKSDFNYNDLLKFLKSNKDTILANETYMKIIYLCYIKLNDRRVLDKEETLELLNEDYKKAILTNPKVNIGMHELSEQEIQKIMDNRKVIENIDDVLWYLLMQM